MSTSPNLIPYPELLRMLRQSGLTVADMPDDVAQSMLALHQEHLMVLYEKKNGTRDVETARANREIRRRQRDSLRKNKSTL